jgi:MFS family permease
LVVLALAVASIVSVADNRLGFTATAELAGRAWSGRALGGQNTMQNVAAFATASFVGLLAGSFGFPWVFVVVAVFPLLGAWLTPVEGSVVLAQRVINLRIDESQPSRRVRQSALPKLGVLLHRRSLPGPSPHQVGPEVLNLERHSAARSRQFANPSQQVPGLW